MQRYFNLLTNITPVCCDEQRQMSQLSIYATAGFFIEQTVLQVTGRLKVYRLILLGPTAQYMRRYYETRRL